MIHRISRPFRKVVKTGHQALQKRRKAQVDLWLTDKKGNFVEIEGFHPSNPYAYENKVVGKYDLAEEGVKLNNYNQQDVLEHINEIKVRIFEMTADAPAVNMVHIIWRGYCPEHQRGYL